MKIFLKLLSLFIFTIKISYAEQMVFEFGADQGQIIYSKDGNIPLLTYESKIDIPVPDNMMITYIKVTVDSFSPPKVDYEGLLKQISIKYTWTQIPASTYNVLVKGTLR